MLEIKTATDRIIAISKELLAWENRRQSVVFEDDLNEVKELMNQWSKDIFLELYKIPFEIRKIIDDDKEGKPISPIKLTLDSPKNVDKILDIFDEYGGVR